MTDTPHKDLDLGGAFIRVSYLSPGMTMFALHIGKSERFEPGTVPLYVWRTGKVWQVSTMRGEPMPPRWAGAFTARHRSRDDAENEAIRRMRYLYQIRKVAQ